MQWITDPQAWIAFVTLAALEIVLGIDNVIFISILVGKLPKDRQKTARLVGLGLAMIARILLLFSLSWLMKLTAPLFHFLSREISGRDLILIIGGIFLIGKSTFEIHDKLEGHDAHGRPLKAASYASVLIQIALLDIIFSLDSVITALGMANQIGVMVCAVIIAVLFMMFFSGWISHFVHQHPTVKMLALAFLMLIGFNLVIDGLGYHVPKGYIYFAMTFSVFVELLNLRLRKVSERPIELRNDLPLQSE